MSDVAPLRPVSIADLLAATAATVSNEAVALGPEGGWRPAPGEWSVNECIGHLIEAEQRGFAGRIRRILEADRSDLPPDLPPDLEDWDPPAVAEARRDHLRDGPELAAEFAALRADGVALVWGLSDADLPRFGRHPLVGELSVEALLGEWVFHDRDHVRQLLGVTQARVWQQMGNAQLFSQDQT